MRKTIVLVLLASGCASDIFEEFYYPTDTYWGDKLQVRNATRDWCVEFSVNLVDPEDSDEVVLATGVPDRAIIPGEGTYDIDLTFTWYEEERPIDDLSYFLSIEAFDYVDEDLEILVIQEVEDDEIIPIKGHDMACVVRGNEQLRINCVDHQTDLYYL